VGVVAGSKKGGMERGSRTLWGRDMLEVEKGGTRRDNESYNERT